MKTDKKLENYQAKQALLEARGRRAKKDNKTFVLIAAAALVVALAGQLAYFSFGPGQQQEIATEDNDPATEVEPADSDETPISGEQLVPDVSVSEDRVWSGSMNLNASELTFDLFGDIAPQAVANFVTLAQANYFEDVSCHRLVTAGIFVLQCGDPSGDGTGGPGYNWGPIENAPQADLYEEGYLAMARRGGDDYSMGSQFFIVYADSTIPSDSVGGYTVFGKITSGLESVKTIAEAGTDSGASDGSPAEQVLISAVSVE
ncbi:MAG: peptidylprolyl isomerase [Aquiluna sp.]|nr:peptidylprolyl isomerase [Aquiluna sp.]